MTSFKKPEVHNEMHCL